MSSRMMHRRSWDTLWHYFRLFFPFNFTLNQTQTTQIEMLFWFTGVLFGSQAKPAPWTTNNNNNNNKTANRIFGRDTIDASTIKSNHPLLIMLSFSNYFLITLMQSLHATYTQESIEYKSVLFLFMLIGVHWFVSDFFFIFAIPLSLTICLIHSIAFSLYVFSLYFDNALHFRSSVIDISAIYKRKWAIFSLLSNWSMFCVWYTGNRRGIEIYIEFVFGIPYGSQIGWA